MNSPFCYCRLRFWPAACVGGSPRTVFAFFTLYPTVLALGNLEYLYAQPLIGFLLLIAADRREHAAVPRLVSV